MQNRLNQNDVTNRVNVEDPVRVRDAVMAVYAARYPGIDLAPITQAFADFQALFEGAYPGFLACDTLYHDMRHTLDMTLALARLVDGHDRSCAAPDRLGPRRAVLGVLIALLHDSGYLRRTSEGAIENGAVFTRTHVSRGAEFIATYLPTLGFGAEAPVAARLVHFTGYEMEIEDIRVGDPRDRKVGCLVGAADLIGQMSDRMYLEKCREFLYREFVWGKIARERLPDGHEVVRYASPEDLIIKTPGFYEYVARTRLEKKLGAADRYAEAFFDGPSLYQGEIDRNMDFLRQTIETADFNRLRRTCYSLSAGTRGARCAVFHVRAEKAGVAKIRLLSLCRNHGKSEAMASVMKPAKPEAAPALYRLLSDSALSRAALGACGVPLAILDARIPARSLTYVNPAFESFFGYRAGDSLGHPLAKLLFRNDEPLVHRLLAEPGARWKLRAWAKDGAVRHVDVSLGAVHSAAGELTHWVVAFSDRSEVEKLRAELEGLKSLAAAP